MKDNWLVGAHILMLFMLRMWLKLYSQLFLQLYPCSHELRKITTRKNSPLGYDFEVTGQALWYPISFISPHFSLLGEVRPWWIHSFFFWSPVLIQMLLEVVVFYPYQFLRPDCEWVCYILLMGRAKAWRCQEVEEGWLLLRGRMHARSRGLEYQGKMWTTDSPR